MNATELRIGNIVFYNGENGKNEPVRYYCTINGADLRIMQDDENYLKSHEPIALTPELLEKCGFEKSEYESNVFEHKGSGLILVYDRGYDEEGRHWHYGEDFEKGNGTSALWKAIDFLHQLQNLYFALTGEELEINLEEK